MAVYTNIAAYKFAPLENLKDLRARLQQRCRVLELKGTILLSTEGINLFIAGLRDNVETLLQELRSLPHLEDLKAKYSESDHQPFRRMLVKLKREIISFGVEGIDPARNPSPKLSPEELKRWLDEGRPVTLLDTRNDYEVKLGTFKGAIDPKIRSFRQFPEVVKQLPEELKEAPVVMFCTGGIRCEKAGPFMEREGYKHVFQLDGGILNYFERCGGDHYEGECFVFDQRVGVDPALTETHSALCLNCQTPLTEEEQADPRYDPPLSCPYCFKPKEAERVEEILKRNAVLAGFAKERPGSIPQDNYRPFIVPAEQEGQTLLDCLSNVLRTYGRQEWAERCEQGLLMTNDRQRLCADYRVKARERLLHLYPDEVEPDVSADIHVLAEDDALVAIHKPAPLPMHPCGRFNRNTLQYMLQKAYAPKPIRAIHRLDANTSGLVLFARNAHLASLVQPQFEHNRVEKVYLARVAGSPKEDTFACDAPISRAPGAAGSRCIDEENGLPARTEFRVLSRDGDTTLLEVRPLTGRTNQIRVHLWHLGYPVLGDPMYLPDGKLGNSMTLSPEDVQMRLHCQQMTLTHPISKAPVSFEAERPEWA